MRSTANDSVFSKYPKLMISNKSNSSRNNKMKRFIFPKGSVFIGTILLVTFFLSSGCGKTRPDGFPKTYTATLTLLHGGIPYDDAKVFLRPVQGAASWSVGGDAVGNGVFRFTTVQGSHSVVGIPAGEYIVTIDHFKIVDGSSLPGYGDESQQSQVMEAIDKMQAESRNNSKVPKKLWTPDASPLRWTINASGTNALTVKLDEY